MTAPMLTNKQEIAFFSVLGLILALFLVLSYVIGHNINIDKSGNIIPTIQGDLPVSAKAAYVFDATTGAVMYAKNENERLPLASLTKVMSALVASDIAPPNSTIVISDEAIRTEGDSGLVPGERWTLKDLLDFSLVSSANDGIRAISLSLGGLTSSATTTETVLNSFVHEMNVRADMLGLKNTYFLNDTGLDESETQGGAYGTAHDMAILFQYILKEKPWILSATREPSLTVYSLDRRAHTAVNTDLAINGIPGLVASKTGYTDLAGGNLVVAYDPEVGRTIIIALLGSSEDGRFQDMMTLVKASLESVKNSVISKK